MPSFDNFHIHPDTIARTRWEEVMAVLDDYGYYRNQGDAIRFSASGPDPHGRARDNDNTRLDDQAHRRYFNGLAWRRVCQEATSRATGIIGTFVNPDDPHTVTCPTIIVDWDAIQRTYFAHLDDLSSPEKDTKIEEAQICFSNAVLCHYGKSVTKAIPFQTLYALDHRNNLSMLGMLAVEAVQKAGEELAPATCEEAKEKWREDIRRKTLESVEDFCDDGGGPAPSYVINDNIHSHIRTTATKIIFSPDRLGELRSEAEADVDTERVRYRERVSSGNTNSNTEYVREMLDSRAHNRMLNEGNPRSGLQSLWGLILRDRYMSNDEWRTNGNLSDQLFMPVGISLYTSNDGSTTGSLLPTVAETPDFPDV